MYDSPTSMDFDSEFSPQSIYDDRDSLNNSFGGRNRQLSTNIRYMEEEEDIIYMTYIIYNISHIYKMIYITMCHYHTFVYINIYHSIIPPLHPLIIAPTSM